ncbi:MAG: QueT transporter family protein [Lachnospiraceae bacterium]|nr:QueT transporter family protein [Lachnospiraceae bacterium]
MKTQSIVQSAMIASLYIALTLVAAGFDLASGAIQVRFSECLTVLPYYTPAAIPGLIIGCLLSNTILGSPLPDIIFGTLATAIAAYASFHIAKSNFPEGRPFVNRLLVSFCPVVSNALIIPFVLTYAYGAPGGLVILGLSVGVGEFIACVVFGQILLTALHPVRGILFG